MAMGTRKDRERQEKLWLSATENRATVAQPFYTRLNELLERHGFDQFVEAECKQFCADKMGRRLVVATNTCRIWAILGNARREK